MIYKFDTKEAKKEYRKKVDEFSDVRWDVEPRGPRGGTPGAGPVL